jgi:hypothetical protein
MRLLGLGDATVVSDQGSEGHHEALSSESFAAHCGSFYSNSSGEKLDLFDILNTQYTDEGVRECRVDQRCHGHKRNTGVAMKSNRPQGWSP